MKKNGEENLLYSYKLKRDKIGRIIKKTERFDEEKVTKHKDNDREKHNKKDRKIEAEYFYDEAGRLVKVKNERGHNSFYHYDQNSNRVVGNASGEAFVAVYDTQDRLIRFNKKTYSYNANGDLLSQSERIKNSYKTTNFVYDIFGQLRTAGNVSYGTSLLQRRVSKIVDGVIQKYFLYNPEGRLIGELDKEGNLIKTFIYASKSHVPDYFIDQNGDSYKLIVDHLGSIRLVVNAQTGEVMQKMQHDEFGRVLKDSNPNFTPFGFAGGLYDSETKLVRFGARDYDAETGRWTSKDPIRFNAGDSNLYGYVLQDPVNFIDPSGKSPFLIVPVIIIIIIPEDAGSPDLPPARFYPPRKPTLPDFTDNPDKCSPPSDPRKYKSPIDVIIV